MRDYRLAGGVTAARLNDALKKEGFVIYAEQGDLSKTLFRNSTMGELNPKDVDRLLGCFARLRA